MHPDQQPKPDYNFILNPATQPKRGFLSGGDKKQRLLLMLAGGGILLVLLLFLVSLLFSGGPDTTQQMIGLAQQQQEIIRIAQLGEKQAGSADTRNYATTVRLSITSSQNELTALIAKKGGKADAKTLALGQNKETDAALTSAQQKNQFDEVFNETIKKSLQTYETDLQATYKASGSQSDKSTLQTLFNRAKILSNDTTTD